MIIRESTRLVSDSRRRRSTQVLDYDYAPASELIENRRIYLNISQEGKSDVEFLREEELLNGLQIATKGP